MSKGGLPRLCLRCGRAVLVNHSRATSMCQECARLPWLPVTNWMQLGRCVSDIYDPELWWPESANDQRVKLAVGICHACPVREKCRDYAITYRIQHGIWGGLMPAQRDALIASRKQVS